MSGGCKINLSVAIDYTASNGDQRHDPSSLHNRDSQQNQYLQALRSVGNILQYYDDDKAIPAYGFGANIGNNPTTWHKFALNGDIFNPECDGIKGVEMAYRKTLEVCQLYGPTNFSQIIDAVNTKIESQEVSQHNQEYNVLMILTDGIISDLEATIDQIVRGSKLGLSIIIVGVGNANFD